MLTVFFEGVNSEFLEFLVKNKLPFETTYDGSMCNVRLSLIGFHASCHLYMLYYSVDEKPWAIDKSYALRVKIV